MATRTRTLTQPRSTSSLMTQLMNTFKKPTKERKPIPGNIMHIEEDDGGDEFEHEKEEVKTPKEETKEKKEEKEGKEETTKEEEEDEEEDEDTQTIPVEEEELGIDQLVRNLARRRIPMVDPNDNYMNTEISHNNIKTVQRSNANYDFVRNLYHTRF